MFSLYNKSNDKYLIHPRCGLWYAEDEQEAKEMLTSCHAYLREAGLDFLIEKITVVKIEE